jgi:hypothetical protein
MFLTQILLLALTDHVSSAVQLRVTPARSQIACETVQEYENYHSSTYEKDGARPRTPGCYRLPPNSVLKDLMQLADAKISGNQVPVSLYEVTLDEKKRRVWLSPSGVVTVNVP